MPIVLQIALGGALGALARFGVGQVTARTLGAAFPYGTLAVNVLGSLMIGALAALMLSSEALAPWRPILITGFLGGFTTFSAFSLETLTLVEKGATGQAALYVILSVVLSLFAVFIGWSLMRGAGV